MLVLTLRESAKQDLIEHFVYLAENGGVDVADRFLMNAQASFNDLAMQPRIGMNLKLKNSALQSIRKWRVKGFDHHLVFYEVRLDSVSVVRVLHASSDWWGLLGFEL